MNSHPETFLTPEALGKSFPPYAPTFSFAEEYIDGFHALVGSAARGEGLIDLGEAFGKRVKGWLRRADALKLYELGYFVKGDILELGSFHGLSTCILSRSIRDTGGTRHLSTVDLDPGNCEKTRRSLQTAGLDQYADVRCADASAAIREFARTGKLFEFVFIDHSHAYEPVLEACRILSTVVQPGGFCLFHDFNDARNADSAQKDYDVYRAVLDGLSSELFEFYGIYGCTALYRRR